MSQTLPTTKKIFLLAGKKFCCPIVVGSGIRSKYQENLMKEILSSPNSHEIIKAIAEVANIQRNPLDQRELTPEQEQAELKEKVLNQKYISVVNGFMVSHYYKYRLILLETLLTPMEELTVAEAFDMATEEEVKAIEDFFAPSVPNKTGTSTTTPIGSAQKKKVKKELGI